ncbi:hypothetical protein [Streptomyces monomycini]|uniref:hypothetical protein n=1 Tax=Streptomyces monomycini TaxID=371720 RepID=UPI0005191605|nr:hypothetical protein [Streptomyces monomycini]
MPAITVDLTEEELAGLCAEAEKSGLSVERLAYGIVRRDVIRRRQQRRTAECQARSGDTGPFETGHGAPE